MLRLVVHEQKTAVKVRHMEGNWKGKVGHVNLLETIGGLIHGAEIQRTQASPGRYICNQVLQLAMA